MVLVGVASFWFFLSQGILELVAINCYILGLAFGSCLGTSFCLDILGLTGTLHACELSPYTPNSSFC